MNFLIVKALALFNIFIIKILIYYSKLEIPGTSKDYEEGKGGIRRDKNEDSKKKETLKRATKLSIIT